MKKVKNYRELKAEAVRLGLDRTLHDVYDLEFRDKLSFEKREDVERRLVEWWNDKDDTRSRPSFQRSSFVLMQQIRKEARSKPRHAKKLSQLM